MEEIENKYIKLLLERCLNFCQSKSLLIQLDLKEHISFAEKVKSYALGMGISDVKINVSDLYEVHEYLKNTELADIKNNSLIDRSIWDFYAKKGGAILFLKSTVPGLMDDISALKIQKLVSLRNESCSYYRSHVTEYLFPWCIAALPNECWAKTIFPEDSDSYSKLYMNIVKMCMIDRDDPVKAWQEWIDKNNYYKRTLNGLKITKLHYTNSLGTDLYIEKPEDNIWFNLDKNDAFGNQMIANMPSYEIFTTPNCYKTEGIVYSSRPLFYNGSCIDKFYMKFHEGKVVDCCAEVGEEVLRSLIFENERACYLGEVALVPYDSPISNTGIVFNDTLFDENASCHLALGRGFFNAIPDYKNMDSSQLDGFGLNISSIHTDFMIGTSDLSIEADTNKGKILIFKDGNFNI